MTIREMTIFKSVFETLSMTRSAHNLYISQPAVSKTISDIENKIQTSLFIRERGKLRRTDFAINLYDKVCRILIEVENLTEVPAKPLKLASSITLANTQLHKILNASPALRVSVVNADDVIKSVLNDQVDFGIVEGSYNNPELSIELIRHIKLEFFVSKKYKPNIKTIDELLQEKILLREEGSSIRIAFDSLLNSQALNYTPTFTSVNSEVIASTILNLDSMAIGLLPFDLINTHHFRLLEIKDLSLKTPVQLVYRKDKHLNQEAVNLLDLIRATI
ncbi:LysR family transcriptional regulator [Erysipelothrix urinaevulpis]|uniref:LysR family transcriptional regulator n=1 Tax=Erysipelothrix urinaevulpis TaxID=2683717 RepID=UPI00135A085B|nr:LysR family transcriptional regulator [Erysipelothrix urinaevulpis]